MEQNKEKIRHILQYYYDKGKNASQAANKICAVYRPDTVSISTAQRFRSGAEVVEDAPRSGRPVVENCDKIAELVERDRHSRSRSIGQELDMSHQTVINHLKKLGVTKKLDVWVPHELTRKNIFDRIDACESLLNRNKIDPFLKSMVTGDEKWVTYDNVRRKTVVVERGEAAQMVAKPGLTDRKVLLCVWWDWQGIIHYELLPYGQTLNSDLYCQQLDRLKTALMQKRPSLINRGRIAFHQDNARPHTSLVTRQKLRELGWEVLVHPPYSPDLAPSDYHLFLSMANALGSLKFATRESCEN
ncbi:histone-lysine N-methyltransferase SETMAR-like [Drosophila ficusphila]|uniref:histone-lysine N-methyltransferase SETMAR-like n=1 Tax=Drosophila ficusphila TaxID=30025 RepID=UPI0007E7BF33|nr:histone-lysine N-methyltransferase SETMAR-like [Drosophila ficusphila]